MSTRYQACRGRFSSLTSGLVGRLFHQLGFTLQRSSCPAHEADPLKQENFKKILPMDEKPKYWVMGRRRSPFSKIQHRKAHVVSEGKLASE